MALAYWFAALAGASCVEIRLAHYSFVCDYSVTRKGEGDPILHGAFRYQAEMLKAKEER